MKKIMSLKAKFGNISEMLRRMDKKKRNVIAISMISVLLLGGIGVGASVTSSADSKVVAPKTIENSAYSIMVNGIGRNPEGRCERGRAGHGGESHSLRW